MANTTRMSTIQAQKARKQKKIAIVGGVILLALLAFLGPRTLKTLHGGSSSSTPYGAVQPTANSRTSTNERDTYCSDRGRRGQRVAGGL